MRRLRTAREGSSRAPGHGRPMTPRWGAGLVFAIMSFPMFLTGGMLTIFLGFEYATTAFIIGSVFVIIGVIVMAVPQKHRDAPAPALFAGVPVPPELAERLDLAAGLARTPRRVECPSCGASPSQVPPSGVVTCEYCEQTYVV